MFTLLFTPTKKHLQVLSRKCLIISVGVAGFEPAAPCSQSRCANRTALHPEIKVPTSIRWHFNFVAVRPGFEPGVPVSKYDGLANRWFQPLTHLTNAFKKRTQR